MKKSLLAAPALLAALSLTLTGCSQPAPSGKDGGDAGKKTPSGKTYPDLKACMVSDEGGFDDKSFNETAHKGLVRAKEELGVQTGEIESATEADFASNIQAMVTQGCKIIVTVGFKLGDATLTAAKNNPDVNFAILDFAYDKETPKNLKSLIFNTAQPSFLAGYAAAGMSKTGVVATYGGLHIPTVTIFMDGFVQGVEQFNKDNGKNVRVEGWDPAKQDGRFVGNFSDVAMGKTITQDFVAKGADVVFPVAGPIGIATLQVAKESNGKVLAVWVDTDGFVSAPEYKDSILTSAAKGLDEATLQAIKDTAEGKFTGDPYIGDLSNGGVSLAPFHEFENKLPEGLKDKVEKVSKDIMDGTIKITSAAQPTKK